MQNKPPYSLGSVDRALYLAALLQQEGSLRVTDAADRLHVSRSTAHRLLAMLVYREFAEQDEDRTYRPGPMLQPKGPADTPTATLRRTGLPHLRALVAASNETAHLMVRSGAESRIVATVECDQILRVGDRAGRALPLHIASCGKAMLAELPAAEVRALYGNHPDVDLPRFERELAAVRANGFGINNQDTEVGLTAIGVAVRDAELVPVAGVAVAMPTARYRAEQVGVWVGQLRATAARIENDLERAAVSS